MGLFDLFREDSAELSVEDMADYVYGVYKVIDKKCNYKDDLSVLNPYERNLYVAMMLEIDVYNGGFEEYFKSQSADYYQEAASSFEELGGYDAAYICRRAIGALGDGLPVTRREREAYYNAAFEDSLDETLFDCETELKEQSDELISLYYAYIPNYESYFADDL